MEGHSNALTEAMALGVVPICSNRGFNQSVVGECGVILSESADAIDYAKSVIELWDSGEWAKFSQQCRLRIRTLFNSKSVVNRLIQTYQRLSQLYSK